MSYPHSRLLILNLLTFGWLATVAASFATAPTITSFSPTSGKLGNTVTVSGTNFVKPATVTFNGVASTTVTVVSSVKLTAVIPNTASTGNIRVQTSGGTAVSASVFTVVPGLRASAATAGPTSARTLYFSGFGAYEAVDCYFDTTDIALVSASSGGAGSAAVSIPASASTGTHWLTAVGRHSGYSAQASILVRVDWPQLGFRSNHSSTNLYESTLTPDTVSNLQESWRTAGFTGMESAPTVVGGVVYATFYDGTIRAFDEFTGAQKWSVPISSGQLSSSPCVSGGVVYVGSVDQSLYALNAATGAQKWKFATGGAIYSSPCVVGGIVYFGSFDNSVYAVNATTGSLVWSYATTGGVYGSPAVVGGVLYVGSNDSYVYALNAATGAQVWKTQLGATINASPLVVGTLVCIGSDDKIMHALRTADGLTAWTYTTGSAIGGGPAVVGEWLFFGSLDNNIYSLSAANGTLRWSYTLTDGVAGRNQICAANGVVYAGNGTSTYAFAASTGQLLTTLPASSGYGGTVVVNGGVLTGDDDDKSLVRYALPPAAAIPAVERPDPKQLHPREGR